MAVSPTYLILLVLVVSGAFSGVAAQQSATIRLDTNLPEALVYSDSVYIGRASNEYFKVPAGQSRLGIVAPNVDSWSMQPQYVELDMIPGDTLDVTLAFPYSYQIESVPFEAQVFFEQPEARTLVGETPLLYETEEPLRGMLVIAKAGYQVERYTPGEEIWNHHRTVLSRDLEESISEVIWRPEKRASRWVEIAAGGLAIASGIAAIRFKTKADRRYSRYELSGDPTLRSGFERYDRYAAISLGAMQVGVGVLAVRLVLD